MAGTFGYELYGRVDHLPGRFYVSTLFHHFCLLPLTPIQSYIVVEGSERDNSFLGKGIPLQLKSVIIGYLRGWLGIVCFFTAGVAALAGAGFFSKYTQGLVLIGGLGGIGGLVWCFYYLLKGKGPRVLLVQVAIILVSLMIWNACRLTVHQTPGLSESRVPEMGYLEMLVVANCAAVLFTFTRVFSRASARRASGLADQIRSVRSVSLVKCNEVG